MTLKNTTGDNTQSFADALDTAHQMMSCEIERLLRYSNSCLRAGDTKEAHEANCAIVKLSAAKAKIVQLEKHVFVIEKALR